LLTLLSQGGGTKVLRIEGSGETVTRGMAAKLLVEYIGWKAPPGRNSYVDVPPVSPYFESAEALKDYWIDSRLWDDEKAFAPEGKFYFHPDQPITRAQFAEMLYLAHNHFGPLW